MKYHLCLKETNLEVEVIQTLPFDNELPYSIRCCTCRGIIFRGLTREDLESVCNKFKFKVVNKY